MLRWLWRDHPRSDDPKDDSNRTLLVPATASAASSGDAASQ
jgi:enterochelin esterase family protein